MLFPRLRRHLPAGRVLDCGQGAERWARFLAPYCDRVLVRQLDSALLDHEAQGSLDLCLSLDALPQAEVALVDRFLVRLSHLLSPRGVAFFHHSNVAAVKAWFRGGMASARGQYCHRYVARRCSELGLHVRSQELVPRVERGAFVDCFTTVHKAPVEKTSVVENPEFWRQAADCRRLAPVHAKLSGTHPRE